LTVLERLRGLRRSEVAFPLPNPGFPLDGDDGGEERLDLLFFGDAVRMTGSSTSLLGPELIPSNWIFCGMLARRGLFSYLIIFQKSLRIHG